ncbi:hypothetical protein [Streptomyces sp. NPDC050355]|uniref:hypothetical protein n=1 Tax=Streptomyces sp. NPDC050355 TaxID=3365609 RepID=UPI0037985165
MSKRQAIRKFLDAADHTDLIGVAHSEHSPTYQRSKNEAIKALAAARDAGATQAEVDDAINARYRR